MMPSEHTYSLLSQRPVLVEDSQGQKYYWVGIGLTKPMLLLLISKLFFKIPVNPEMRNIAVSSQYQAERENQFPGQNIIAEEFDTLDDNCYYAYEYRLRNILDPSVFENIDIKEILDWTYYDSKTSSKE